MVTSPAAFLLPCPGLQASELWEVEEEPRGRLGAEGIMPERQEGHLLKKRKWPLKGWHKVGWAGQREGPDAEASGGWGGKGVGSTGCVCGGEEKSTCVVALSPYPFLSASWVLVPSGQTQRYFVLEDGVLHYATTRQEVSQGLCWGLWAECGPRMVCTNRGLYHLFFFFLMFVLFLRQKVTEHELGRGREREGDTESEGGSRL